MKIYTLVIFIISISTSAFNLHEMFDDGGNSSIKIYSKNRNSAKAGEVIFFSANICSVENLESFSAKPSREGENKDAFFYHIFNEKTTSAVVSYYYIVPTDAEVGNQIIINFYLRAGKSVISKQEVIEIIS